MITAHLERSPSPEIPWTVVLRRSDDGVQRFRIACPSLPAAQETIRKLLRALSAHGAKQGVDL